MDYDIAVQDMRVLNANPANVIFNQVSSIKSKIFNLLSHTQGEKLVWGRQPIQKQHHDIRTGDNTQ